MSLDLPNCTDLIQGLGVPKELFQGTLQTQAPGVALKIFNAKHGLQSSCPGDPVSCCEPVTPTTVIYEVTGEEPVEVAIPSVPTLDPGLMLMWLVLSYGFRFVSDNRACRSDVFGEFTIKKDECVWCPGNGDDATILHIRDLKHLSQLLVVLDVQPKEKS